MKRIISLMMCLAMLCSFCMGAMAETKYTAGTYGGRASGFGGDIKVSVTLSENAIESIEVLEHSDTAGISDGAYAQVPQAIIDTQSTVVDTVSGCTISSKGIMAAVSDAIANSTGEKVVNTELEKKTVDVIVIGSGGAGMTAAVEVLRAGGSVIVIEKTGAVGGNTIAAGSALNAAGSDIQKSSYMSATSLGSVEDKLALEPKDEYMARWQESVRKDLEAYKTSGSDKVFDTVDLHKLMTYVDGDYVGKPELIEILCDGAPQALKYLEELGMSWRPEITTAVGATWARSHQPSGSFGGNGADFVLPQYEFVIANGGEVILEHKAEELIVENGRVVGVKGSITEGGEFEYRANKGVIMATGGFGANVELRQKYNKYWANLDESVPTSNRSCATGDGLVMAEAIGASLYGEEWIQMVTGSALAQFTASIANNIYVNAEGNRFVAEDERRDVLSGAVLEQTGSYFWYLNDSHTVWDLMNGVSASGQTLEQKLELGMIEAQTIEELAEKMGVPYENLQASIDQFNKAVVGEEEDPLGRKSFQYTFDKGPYYTAKGVAMVHHTMGGIEINANCEVLDTEGNVIPGFYAAGEVTGGIHGANRLGGNAIADIIVFGQIAGQNAMK